MDKEDFLQVLQAALLFYDGVSLNELIKDYQIEIHLAKAGAEICDFLKEQEMPT